jgi:hypothetical protein
MNSKELFGCFLRVVGVLGILYIVRHAANEVLSCSFPSHYYLLIKWVLGVLVGLYLMRGAPAVVKFAYPEKPAQPAP